MFFLYKVITNLFYPFLILLIYTRKIFKKEDRSRYKEKIFISSFNVKRNKKKKLFWFHAASIGELRSILPIINKLSKDKRNLEFLITTVTLSSGKLAKEEIRKIKNVKHRFLPIDVDFLIKSFLDTWKPNVIFLVDSEIWPNIILNAKKRQIPLAIINGRISNKTFSRWNLVPSFRDQIFSSFNLALSSNKDTEKHLKLMNAKNVHFSGNIKFIGNTSHKKINKKNESFFDNKKFWLAVSTHQSEEKLCLETHLKIKKFYENSSTIIAPRHIDRMKEIKTLCETYGLKYQILNKSDFLDKKKEIILINSFGALNEFYKYTNSVFIGKSTIKKLENDSGQSPIDAAKFGCKIYHGPYISNFQEIYNLLKSNKIAFEIKSSEHLAKSLINDYKNSFRIGKKTSRIINRLGLKTLNSTIKHINNFLSNENI